MSGNEMEIFYSNPYSGIKYRANRNKATDI